ncbi:MAG: hypothetical protein FD177_1029 [Desulfovibrionaceae bacterium]|nr:MAG: hypothetical protein FD177_1029 [Desulfovibrionaceae bacterium]
MFWASAEIWRKVQDSNLQAFYSDGLATRSLTFRGNLPLAEGTGFEPVQVLPWPRLSKAAHYRSASPPWRKMEESNPYPCGHLRLSKPAAGHSTASSEICSRSLVGGGRYRPGSPSMALLHGALLVAVGGHSRATRGRDSLLSPAVDGGPDITPARGICRIPLTKPLARAWKPKGLLLPLFASQACFQFCVSMLSTPPPSPQNSRCRSRLGRVAGRSPEPAKPFPAVPDRFRGSPGMGG